MSKEFEEIVLKKLEKLDVLEDRTQNTDKVIEEIVLKKLDVLDERTKNTEKELKATQQEIKSIHDELKTTQETVQNLSENVRDINNRFTVFEFEINKKIDTLFDAITANNEKHDVFEKSIVSLNTKTFNHDIRISVLEDYSKNDKLFATS